MRYSPLSAIVLGSLVRALVVFQPFYSFTHLPDTMSLLAFFDVDALPVLLALVPLTLVAASVGPRECARAMFLIILVFAYVFAAVTPREHSSSLHPVINPISLEDTAVGPDVLANTVNIVLLEIAIVSALIAPNELSFAMFHTFHVFSRVLSAVRPLFDSLSMLLVVEPLALVPASIIVGVNSETIGLVFVPGAFVNIALSMDQTSISAGHAVFPKSIIPGSVGPNLYSTSIPLISLWMPFSLVHSTIFQVFDWFNCSIGAIVYFLCLPVEWFEGLNNLQNDLVIVLLHENVHLLILEKVNGRRWVLSSRC